MTPTHHQQAREVRRKHEDALLHSMTQQQRRLTIPPMALPSFNESWTSLKTQLLTELQRLARKRRITLVEMRAWMLTQGAELTKEEWAWVTQTRKLVSVMPPLPLPPGKSSMSTTLHQEAPNPLSTSTPPNIPNPSNLMHQIFWTDQYPIPDFASRYPRVMKHPSVATLMVPPSDPMKSEVVTESPVTSSHQMSHLDLYGTTALTLSRSPSLMLMESPNTPTTSTSS